MENRKEKMTVPLWNISETAAIMREVEAMNNDETKCQLRELNGFEMITGLEIQQSEPDTLAWSFDDRIQRLVDYPYQEKYTAEFKNI